MPFLPLPDNGPEKPQTSDFGLFVIRVMTVAAFFYYQLWDQVVSAQDYVWNSGDWDLISQLANKGFPFPNVVAVAGVLILVLGLLAALFGIFTRINALVVSLLIGFILIAPLILSSTLNPQSLVLYLGVFIGLACGGGGRVSLDHFLAGRKARRKLPD